MSTGDTLKQAWQWLVPPVVEDGLGRLISRRRSMEVPPQPSAPATLQPEPKVEEILMATAADTAADAIDSIETQARSEQLLAHPDASHRTALHGRDVAYLLRRSKRRSIGFAVGALGLEVTAPQWLAQGEIEAALQTKADWIVRKLQEASQRQRQRNEARIHWQDGGVLDYLGRPLVLHLTGGEALASRTRQTHREQAADGSQSLHLPLACAAPAAQVRAAVQAWILREARTHFTARLLHYAPLLGVRWNALRLSSASTRWGSANSDGIIRLNWRLMQHGPQIIDYVVVHELAHLLHMDHSAQFWAVVAEVLPDWKRLRKSLRDKPLPAWE